MKKSLKVMRRFVVSVFLAILVFAAGVATLGYAFFQAQIFDTIKVGIVLPEDTAELKMISQIISSMDSVKAICQFEYMDSEDAIEKLEEGTIQAVISLPESLYQDIYEGTAAQVNVYLPENSTLNVQIFQEVLNDGVKMVQTAEASVFAVRKGAGVYGANISKDDAALSIAYLYMEEAFARGDIFQETVLLPFGDMDLYQYYIAAGITIILLILGVNYSCLYPEYNQIIEKKLCITGMGPVKLSLVKVLVMSLGLWIFLCSCYGGLCILTALTSIPNLWFDMKILGGFWFLAIAVASWFHLIYAFFGNGYLGSVFMLLMDGIMLLCSGALIPLAYMPECIKHISRIMPLNYWNQYCAGLLFDTAEISLIGAVLTGAIGMFMIGVLCTWNNISHGIFFSSKRG